MEWPSLAEIRDLARLCAQVSHSKLLTYDARYEAAYDGIVEAVANGETDLKGAAFRSMGRAVDKVKKDHGLPDEHATGSRTGAKFAKYWHGHSTPGFEDGFSDRIIEDMAVRQVWRALPQQYQGTISAIVHTHGNVGLAAAAQGVGYGTYATRLMTARRAARSLWFDFEPDSGHYKKSYTTRPGQQRSESQPAEPGDGVGDLVGSGDDDDLVVLPNLDAERAALD